MIGRNDPCWCGSKKKWKACHFPKLGDDAHEVWNRPDASSFYRKQWGILLKTEEQIRGIKNACAITAKILDAVCLAAKPGVTTEELNTYANELHVKYGVIPATLHYGYPPYPKSICTSINDVICHGIPGAAKLRSGDIVNIDCSVIANGYFGDCSRMVMIGDVSDESRSVVETAKHCLYASIAALKPGVPVSEIGEIITREAHKNGCSVVDRFVGHGVGVKFHEPPEVPHHRNRLDIPLAAGMTFTIEPMINAGVKEAIISEQDGWTARTKDGKPSAQWEHTLLITKTGVEILTPWSGSLEEYSKYEKAQQAIE